MTRIDFYILPDDSAGAGERLSCRLAEKIYKMGRSVYLHTASAEQAARLDELLWTYRAGSFVPHARCPDVPAPPPPVLIGCSDEPPECDVLVNLAPGIPSRFSRFERVAEIVDGDAANRRSGRERYRFYRDRGYPLHSHRVARA